MKFFYNLRQYSKTPDANGHYTDLGVHPVEFTQIKEVQSEESRHAEDFGVVDNKGRAVGGGVYLYTVTVTEINRPIKGNDFPEGTAIEVSKLADVAGVRYVFVPGARRGGEHFGASQGGSYFRTKEARAAAGAKYFAAARTRAIKQWGGK